jgi:hypothetical protein
MAAFDVAFDFLISSAQASMRLSQIELDSISVLLQDTSSSTIAEMDYFIKSIQDEQDFWSNWKSRSPVAGQRRTWENPFQDFNSLKPKTSSLTLNELQDLVGLHDPHSKLNRRKQLKEWLKSKR